MSDIEARARAYAQGEWDELGEDALPLGIADAVRGSIDDYLAGATAEVELERKRIFPLVRELALRAYERGRFKEASFYCRKPDNLEPFDIWLMDEFKKIIEGA